MGGTGYGVSGGLSPSLRTVPPGGTSIKPNAGAPPVGRVMSVVPLLNLNGEFTDKKLLCPGLAVF